MALSDEECEVLWTSAAKQEIGIKVKVNPKDIKTVMNDLYEWRKGKGFENIAITVPEGGDHLFLVKKTVELE